MKRKIIATTIYLELIDRKYYEDFIELSAMLAQNNFIEGENRVIRASEKSPNIMEIICIFTSRYTYNNWLNQDFIIENFQEKFNTLLLKPPYTKEFVDVISEVDKINVCHCKESNHYYFMGKKYPYEGGLYCHLCESKVPLYKFNDTDIDISNWLDIFYNIYQVYLYIYDSDSIENWCIDMIYDINSDLNKNGIKIAKEISVFLKKRVYYILPSKEGEHTMICPFCKSEINQVNKNHICWLGDKIKTK